MKKTIILAAVVLLLIVVGGYGIKKGTFSSFTFQNKNLTEEEAKNKVADYINNNLVQPGTTAEVKGVAAEGDLYKVTVGVQGQEVTSYMTKDGSKFFANAFDMNAEKETQPDSQNAEAEVKEIPKSEKPKVELFVMSYCPYGTQIEKGVLPVVGALGNKIDFQLKFVDYAMHDKKEIGENLRQYCIQKNEPEKLTAYLANFLKTGEGTEDESMKEAGINAAQVTSCMTAADKEFQVTASYDDKSTWNNGQFPQFNVDKADNEKYGVQGSPTLVINETVAQSGRDSASLLKTICSGFENAPEECSHELSSAAPSPGFGEGTSASASDASCGE